MARVLWFISFSSSLRAFLTVAWFHCSQGRSSSLEKLQEDKTPSSQFHLGVNKSRHNRTKHEIMFNSETVTDKGSMWNFLHMEIALPSGEWIVTPAASNMLA